MSSSTDHYNAIALEALSLSTRERGDLAARLLKSLSPDAPLEEDENLALVLERVRRYEAGEMTVRPAREVLARLGEKHGL